MMKCIEAAVAAGHISREEGQELQREVSGLLRRGLAAPEMKLKLIGELEAAALQQRRRALLTEARRAELEQLILTHRNARGENDPAQAIVYLLEHHGQARFADVEHRRIAILAGIHADIEQFLWEFRKGALTGDKRRNQDEVRARLDDVVRELHGERTRSAPAAEMAKAVARAIETLRQRFNAAGGHIAKLDNYVPQHHDPEALMKAGRKAWVDYMLQKDVLDRTRMTGIDGKPLGDDDLRHALEVAWERITTDGWIDREPSAIPHGAGALWKRHTDARFLHFKDAQAWIDYQRTFAGGDPYSALLGYIARMSRDVAFMEIMGPNPDMMRTWLQQVILKQGATAKPAAVVVAEQTAWLKDFVTRATGGGKYDDMVAEVGRIVQELAELQRRQGAIAGRDVRLEHQMWNKTEELARIKARIGDMDAGSVVSRHAELQSRAAEITAEIERIAGKGAPQLDSLSRRNKQKVQKLRQEEAAIQKELGTLASKGKTLQRADPEIASRLQQVIDVMRGDLARAAHADDLAGVESVIETLVKKLEADPAAHADELARRARKIDRLETARNLAGGRPATPDELQDATLQGMAQGPRRPPREALGAFRALLAAVREWRNTGDLRLKEFFTDNLERAIEDYHHYLDGMQVDREKITHTLTLMREAEDVFLRPQAFRSVDDPMSAARSAIKRFDRMWDVMRGRAEAPVNATFANTMQGGRNIMSAALLGQASIASLADVVFQRAARTFAGVEGGAPRIVGQMVQQFAGASRREAVRAGLILDSALHVMETQARYLEAVDTRSLTGYIADRVITYSGLSAWTQAGKHAFGMAIQSELAERVGLKFFELPDLLRSTLERHGMGSREWDIMRTAARHKARGELYLLRPNEIAKAGPQGREVAEMYLAMIHRETKFAVPEASVAVQSMLKSGQPGTMAGELSRNFAQFKSFGAAVLMSHGRRIAEEYQGGRQGRAVWMASGLLVTGAMAGALVIELKDLANGKHPRGLRQWQEGKTPGAGYWLEALLQAGGLGIVGDFLFSGVNRLGGGLSSFIVGPFGGQLDRMRDRTFGNIDEFAKGENMKLSREAVATVRDLMPGGTLWYLRLAKERLLMNQIEHMLDPEAARKSWKGLESRTRKKQHTDYWWRPGQMAPGRAPLQMDGR